MARLRGTAPPRQGVILLIVVILLTLFMVVGLSFVLYAEAEANASRIYRESQSVTDDRADEDTTKLLNHALGQLIYDVRDDGESIYSALRGHSLARTMYGWNYAYSPGSTVDKPQYDWNYYNGNNSTANQIPFNGLGALRSPTAVGTTPLTTIPNPVKTALMPYREDQLLNYTAFLKTDAFFRDPERLNFRTDRTVAPTSNTFTAGFNVPYTYPDRNNMFLAAVQGTTATPKVLIPSFFRPFKTAGGTDIDDFAYGSNFPSPDAKLKFWLDDPTAPVSAYNNPAAYAYKYLTLRPRPADMYFNYNDPNDPNNFPLPLDAGGDVTNLSGAQGFKGANTSDSFWMDLNYPVLTARNGRKYKPLFALLVNDLDGKVNVNVHGNLRGSDESTPPKPIHASNQGVGKHEVNLAKVLNADATSAANPEWKNLFTATTGRYGFDRQPGSPTTDIYPDLPLGTLRSYLAKLDYDAVDETTSPNPFQVSRKFAVPLPQYRVFPDFAQKRGYDDLTGPARLNNPLLYNALIPRTSDTPFALNDNVYYLHGQASGTNHQRAVLYKLLPKNLDSTGRRFMLTTHSYDLDVPGMMPCVDGSTYKLPNGQFFPKGMPQQFSQNTLTNAQPVSDARSQFTAPPPLASMVDGRVPLLSRIDLNRPLHSFFDNSKTFVQPANGPNDRFTTARNDRQYFATDIFHRLIQATGANRTANKTTQPEEYDALRWLAQLAANIVDYIDDDDIATAFDWVSAKNLVTPNGYDPMVYPNAVPYSTLKDDYVFGTEAPRVLLSEIYAEYRNKPGDDNEIQGATLGFDVNFFIELFNPMSETNDNQISTEGKDRHTAILKATPANAGNPAVMPYNVYQIEVYDENVSPPGDLRKADNVTGAGTGSFKCQLTDFAGTANSSAMPDVKLLRPNDASSRGPAGDNKGYYVVSADADFENGTNPNATLKVSNGLSYTVANAVEPPVQPPLTVLLRRLANPHQPPQTNPMQPNYNPYITVDYQTGVRVSDAIKYGQNPAPPAPTPPHMGIKRDASGRAHPATADLNQVALQTSGNPPKNSFFEVNTNANNGQFDWLVHLDRPLTSVAELLQVSAFKPHELTQQFYVGTPVQKFDHRAKWLESDARIYRAFEFFAVGERNLPAPPSLSFMPPPPTPPYAIVSKGGRKAGTINLNTVWDREVLQALCDRQENSNNFTDADVDNDTWNAINGRRGTPTAATAKPYVGPGAPHASPGDQQFDPQNGTAGVQGGYTTGTFGSGNPPPGQHPFLTSEMLAKVAGHLTTRSNVFEVYVTVGFFEVKDDTARPVKLGAEIRARDGSFIRHKMFAVVDRTNLGLAEPLVASDLNNVFKQSSVRPIYVSAEGAIPRTEGVIPPIPTVISVPKASMSENYDPSYDPSARLQIWPVGSYIYIDTGVRRERIQVAAVDQISNPQYVFLTLATPTQYDHPAGTTLSTFRSGNPGPQDDNSSRFDVNDARYKYVVPFSKVVE